jgi:dipeptidase D
MDMVCVKTVDLEHNFETDPLELYEEDGYLKAKNTSLGADNGI